MINYDEESVYAHLVVTDCLADKIGFTDKRAYLRAWVLRHRTTGVVRGLVRFHQTRGKNWTEIRAPDGDAETLRQKIEETLLLLCRNVIPEVENPVACYYPPAGATPKETIDFLLQHGLIEIVAAPLATADGFGSPS